MKQLNLLEKPPMQFGGSFDQRHKIRTLCSRRPIHLTLKSNKRYILFKSRDKIREIIFKQAKSVGIKVYAWSVQKDHIHLSIKIPNREAYKKWIRAMTGLIARLFGKGLWKFRPFTRILGSFGREFQILNNYIFRNELEIFKIWNYDRSLKVIDLANATQPQIVPFPNFDRRQLNGLL